MQHACATRRSAPQSAALLLPPTPPRGCATAIVLGLPLDRVLPSIWTRALRLPGKVKRPGAAMAMARELYPAAAELLDGPRGGAKDGRADALLIAHWASTRRDTR